MTSHVRHCVSDHCQLNFCSKTLFWIYSALCVCHSYSQNPYEDVFDAEMCKIQYSIWLLRSVLMCCQYAWRHEMKTFFWIADLFWGESTGQLILLTMNQQCFDVTFVVRPDKLLNEVLSRSVFDKTLTWCHSSGLAQDCHSYSCNQ